MICELDKHVGKVLKWEYVLVNGDVNSTVYSLGCL